VIPAFLGVGDVPQLLPSDRRVVDRFDRLLVAVAGGEHDPERGLLIVVRALKKLSEIVPGLGGVFVGWQIGPKVEALIRDLGLSDRAVCLGEVAHERCLGFMRAADVVVRSTFADGDAITVREALALDIAVVASDTDFRPPGVTLFRKGDEADLVAKLRDVLAGSGSERQGGADASAHSAVVLWQLYREVGRSRLDDLEASPLRGPDTRELVRRT
jgi:glycosyltransferase involved in cell wall biosynthesis